MPLKMFQDEQPAPNLLPMIDVVFQLVLFLMLGAQFQEMERNMNVKVPQVSESNLLPITEGPQKKVVNVQRDGRITVDNRETSLKELHQVLAQARGQYADLAVIVRGDAESIYKNVATVLYTCKQAGVDNVSISLRLTDENPKNN